MSDDTGGDAAGPDASTGPDDRGMVAARSAGAPLPAGAPSPPPVRARRPVRRRSFLGRHPWRLLAVVSIVVVVVVAVAGVLWLQSEADPSGGQGAQVLVTVRDDATVGDVASLLAEKGVVGSSLALRVWLRLHGTPIIVAGDYAFNKNDTFADVKAVLSGSPNVFTLTVPPGFTVSELAERVGQYPGFDATSFEALADGGTIRSPWQPVGVTSLEGLLGTGDYRLVPGETETQLLTAMVDRFTAEANSAGLTSGAAALGMTPYQVIIVASIVEKEGVISANLGPVARVVYNRLAADMTLDMDSTVLYAEGRDGGPVTEKDEQTVSPYNTYLNKGLTPTPTCFPSPAALAAAISPPPGSWLYFVVVESDGTEAFSDTYAQQQANEKLAQQRGLS